MIIGRAGPPPTLSGTRPSETSEMERLLRPLGEWQEPRRNLGDEGGIFGEQRVFCAAEGAIVEAVSGNSERCSGEDGMNSKLDW